MIRITDWCVVGDPRPYVAPELKGTHIKGAVFGHPIPEFPDGMQVVTSKITSVKGRTFTTASGHQYRLGKIEKGYRKFLYKDRPNWNWRQPITVIQMAKSSKKGMS